MVEDPISEKFIGEKKKITRCPKCNQETLVFDEKTGKVHCNNCAYEQQVTQSVDE